VTKFDIYPLPVFEETTSNLHGSKYYSVVDCYSGSFWQISIKEEHKERTGFSVPSGHYEFNKLPVELSMADGRCLKNLAGTECWVFIDDVIIFSRSMQEHAKKGNSITEV